MDDKNNTYPQKYLLVQLDRKSSGREWADSLKETDSENLIRIIM